MAAEVASTQAALPNNTQFASISLPPDFKFAPQDNRLEPSKAPRAGTPPPPLGILGKFHGTFAGKGFNMIFLPNSGPPNGTSFPKDFQNPVAGPPIPQAPNKNVLELNLTQETISFSKPIGTVPNRGLQAQQDIFLNGVPYLQTVDDVTNTATGKADNIPSGTHVEPGLWMHVPATDKDPILGESLCRMGSIPHGATINAQCLAPTSSLPGPPQFQPVDPTPTPIGGLNNKGTFAAQTASATNTPRLPQDLSKFIANGTITQATLTNPNTVLEADIVGQEIVNTTVFTVSTNPTAPDIGGGTANIGFLQEGVTTQAGAQAGPNANALEMSATFWIETMEHELTIPAFKPGQSPLKLTPKAPHPGGLVPTFLIEPPEEITDPKTVTVSPTQIQYSQVVQLTFAGLNWPHVSVATLIPKHAVKVSNEVFS